MEIKQLGIDNIGDWFAFFEEKAFEDNPEWRGCYCTACFYPKPKEYPNLTNKRKDYADWLIRSGRLRGYLAYESNRVIGWVNANKKTEMTRWNDGNPENEKVLSIACFIVVKEHRGKGVATNLLQRIIHDSSKQGYSIIEAYPKKGAKSEYGRWNGPFEMYRKAGFEEVETANGKVVRKSVESSEV